MKRNRNSLANILILRLSKLLVRILIVSFLLLAGLPAIQAQDLHFSQFYYSPLNVNPALGGTFRGDMHVVAGYRDQWSSVPVPYMTFSAAFDQKYYSEFLPNGFFSWGFIFNYDRAGDSELSWTQAGFNLAYTHRLEDEHFLTAGFQFKAGQRAFRPEKLTFDDQYNGDIFDPELATSELFTNTSKGYIDLGAGLNYLFLDNNSRSELRGGMSFYHLNQPRVGFFDDDATQLPMLLGIYGMGLAEIHPVMDIRLQAFWQSQGPYRELVGGGALKYHLNQKKGDQLAILSGVSYRWQDALIVHFEVFYRNWTAGVSYDINTSAFSVATSNRGGIELSVQYVLTRVKPPDTFKSCPIF